MTGSSLDEDARALALAEKTPLWGSASPREKLLLIETAKTAMPNLTVRANSPPATDHQCLPPPEAIGFAVVGSDGKIDPDLIHKHQEDWSHFYGRPVWRVRIVPIELADTPDVSR